MPQAGPAPGEAGTGREAPREAGRGVLHTGVGKVASCCPDPGPESISEPIKIINFSGLALERRTRE